MSLGYHGETCAEAIRVSISAGEVVRYSDFFRRVQEKGKWKDATIRRHLMSCIVNLPPAQDEWKSRKPFLFLRGDGGYELYASSKHPKVIE